MPGNISSSFPFNSNLSAGGMIRTTYELYKWIFRQILQFIQLIISIRTCTRSCRRDPLGGFEIQMFELSNRPTVLMQPFAQSEATLNIDEKRIVTGRIKWRHKQLSISADCTGYELATTLNDHIEVNLEREKFGVYLYWFQKLKPNPPNAHLLVRKFYLCL